MKSSKLLLVFLTVFSSCYLLGCTKDQSSESDSLQKASDGLSLFEKAKVARAVRKMEKEEKRKILSEKYSLTTHDLYDVKVFFEDEMVESDDMNLWIQPEFIGVLKTRKDDENQDSPRESISLINDSKKYTAFVAFGKKYSDVDYSSDDFCRDIVSKTTKYSNVNIVVPPSLLKGEQSSICRLSYQDLSTNKFINEFTEVYKNGSVIYTSTSSSNAKVTGRDILKTAFSRAVSKELKDAVRHASTDFFDTEKYHMTDI